MRKEERIKNLIKGVTVDEEISTRTLKDQGYNRDDINMLFKEGILKRIRRGFYKVHDLTRLGIKFNRSKNGSINQELINCESISTEAVSNIFSEPLLQEAYFCFKNNEEDLAIAKIKEYIMELVQNNVNQTNFDITSYLLKFYYYATAGRDFNAARVYLNFIRFSASLSRLYEESHALDDFYAYHFNKFNNILISDDSSEKVLVK